MISIYNKYISVIYNNFFTNTLDYKLVNLYRFLYCITTLILCVNIINQFDFIYGNDSIISIYFIYLLIFLVSLFQLGYTNIIIRILIFSIKSYCLLNCDTIYNIEIKFALTLSFWNIFFDFYNNKNPKSWPLKLFCISFFMNFCTGGGLTKFFDEIWFTGYGLYYALNVDWCNSYLSKIITSNQAIVVILNYIVIFLETFCIIFIFIKKLKIIAFITLVSFTIFTLFILRIDLIGQYSTSIIFILFPLFIKKDTKLTSFLLFIEKLLSNSFFKNKVSYRQFYPTQINYILGLFVFFLVLISSLYSILINVQRQCSPLNGFVSSIDSFRYKFKLYYIQEFVGIRYDHLFTRMHFEDLVGFRAIVSYNNGSESEPVCVFNSDLTGGKDTQDIFSSRFYSAFMYRCTIFNRMIRNSRDSDKVFHESMISPQVYNFLRHVNNKSIIKDSKVSNISLLISPIIQPSHYDFDFYYPKIWYKVLIYYPEFNKFEIINDPSYQETFPVSSSLDNFGFNVKHYLRKFY